MHHLYPMAKGDPLCPLGFHPQVRWPTRCKRCFRDYKEHGGRKDDSSSSTSLRRESGVTASTPSLPTSWTSPSRSRESSTGSSSSGIGSDSSSNRRGTTTSSSSTDLTRTNTSNDLSSTSSDSSSSSGRGGRAASWTSTPDLNSLDEDTTCVTIRVPLRSRARPTPVEPPKETPKPADDYRSAAYTFRRRTIDLAAVDPSDKKAEPVVETKTATTTAADRSRARRATTALPIKDVTELSSSRRNGSAPRPPSSSAKSTSSNPEVEFILQVKSSTPASASGKKSLNSSDRGRGKKVDSSSSSSEEGEEEEDDASSMTGTETTETTIVDRANDDEIMELKREVDTLRVRCEKLEREKSDILLRRLAGARETAPSSGEALKLQQRVHELQQAVEDLRDEKHSLSLRVKELEEVADSAAAREPELRRTVEELRNKLSAAETLCEELMDENEEIKKEIRDLEEEIDEMQDNFREDQANEYSSLKKELDQTAKNCRILQFKLRKSERKCEALEAAKLEAERQLGDKVTGPSAVEKVRTLEKELKLQSEVSERLQKEVDDLKTQLAKEKAATAAAKAKFLTADSKTPTESTATKKKPPMLGKSASGEPITRASLTRGGSQDDPVQLLRDLQDAMEREADLREQLRFAEEEAQNSRKKCSRLEDDNDSLAMQLKKMATKARSRRHSPSPARLTPEPSAEKDEGISDDDDPAELRLQLELNEQESAVLRRKVEELEKAGEASRKQVKELQEKLAISSKAPVTPTSPRTVRSDMRPASSSAAVLEKKIAVLEEEASELRKKLIEKERDYERVQAEMTVMQKRPKGGMSRSRSLDGSEQNLDLKRQLQVIEQEATVLRTRTQDLEAANDKLTAENKRLSLRAARSRTPAKDTTVHEEGADAKEVASLKEKVASLEKQLTDANNQVNELKAKTPLTGGSAEVEKIRNQLAKLEKENENLKAGGLRLRTRTPKKPTDLTTKLQLKKMVDELEEEVAELLVGLNKTKDSAADAGGKVSEATAHELEELKKERDKLKKDLEKEKSTFSKEKSKIETDLKKMTAEKTKVQDEVSKLQTENKKVKEDLEKLKSSQDAAKAAQGEVTKLQAELEEAKALVSALQREHEESAKEETKKVEAEKAKLQKEIADKTKKLTDAEKKAKEVEDKLKKTEKILSGKKEKLTKAEKDLEAEREKLRQSEGMQKEVAVGWLRERDELKASVTEMTRRAEQLEEQLAGRAREVEALEGSLSSERAMVAELKKTSESTVAATSAAVEKQLAAAREELSAAKSRATDLAAQLEKAEKAKRAADDKARKDIADLQTRLSENESGRTSEKQKLELQIKEKEQEIRSLGNQLKTAQQEAGSKKVAEIQEECNQKIKKLENDLSSERQEYEELTARYELLEEEHVVTKAQLTMDRDKAETALSITQQELATLDGELQTLRETYNSKQDTWIKEKLDMQEQLRELEEKISRGGGESWHLEKNRLKAQLEEKASDMEKTKHELDVLSDQLNYTRKESEELRRKLEDFDKVSKVQRNITADTNALTKELKDLRSKLLLEEKNHKTEVAQLKMRYDSRVALISEEMQSLQSQVAKFKRERDSHRHMLEAAQKTIGELRTASASTGGKNNPVSHISMSPSDESEETRTKIATLEQQLGCMEDELSDARLEASKLKTELVSERSAWEVKLSEMQSRLNELEEDRLISTGRTKIPGMRTRMELAWQKEREEQHRLLQETSTLARDLRQTLFEVERERDKERLEGKRKLDQLKKNMEEEMEENRKKITEMQYDLLELRDAHAKLRTTNEKLRRERERWDKERDDQRQQATFRKRQELDEERKINSLLEQVEELMRLAPDLFPERPTGSSTNLSLPVPPKRTKGPRSRESSPGMERKDYSREPSVGAEDRKQQMHSTLMRLTEATNELRKYQRLGEEEKDRERARRTLGFRRAASTEAEPPPSEGQNKLRSQKANGSSNKKGSLFRKSLSLEQTSGGMSQDQTIWTGEDGGSMNSLQSLESEDARFLNMQRRDPSVDRLSTDSTQSESPDKKKKKGLFGKLKSLKKSKSIEDSTTGDFVLNAGLQAGSIGGSGSDISVDISTSGTGKKDMKDRIAGMFKKGTTSRGSSVERSSMDRDVPASAGTERAESLQKPVKNTGLSKPSPAAQKSDSGQTSSASRPLAPTVAQQKPTLNQKPSTTASASTPRRFIR